MQPHCRHLIDRSQRSQNTERPQRLKTLLATRDRQHANNADAHDEEIEAIPGLSQVSKLVEDEAKADYLDYGFNDEDYGEDQVNLLLDGRPV